MPRAVPRWGGGAVVVCYLGNVQAAFLTSPREDKTPYPTLKGFNFIDDYVLPCTINRDSWYLFLFCGAIFTEWWWWLWFFWRTFYFRYATGYCKF